MVEQIPRNGTSPGITRPTEKDSVKPEKNRSEVKESNSTAPSKADQDAIVIRNRIIEENIEASKVSLESEKEAMIVLDEVKKELLADSDSALKAQGYLNEDNILNLLG